MAHWTLVLALGLAACAPAEPSPDAPPSVVVFLIDTLRADALGVYGSPDGATPALDALARESVVFESAHAPAPWTLPSVASLLTSRFPCEHGVLVDGDRVPSEIATLAERMREAGHATASLYANPYAGSMSGLDRGFDLARQGLDANGRAVARALPDPPFFLYVHNTEPHDPYQEKALGPALEVSDDERRDVNRRLQQLRRLTRADYTAGRPIGSTDNTPRQRKLMRALREQEETVRALYAKDAARADARLGQVVEALRERGLLDDTIFVVLSDHGEEFDEHGAWQHDQSVYEELLRVPLLIRLPAGRLAGTRIDAPVSLVDVMPTLASLLGMPEIAEGARGHDLVPLMEGREADAAPRVTAMRINRKKYFRPIHETRGDENVVVREGRWKAIWNVAPERLELYDLASDPREQTDLAAREPERAARMRAAAEEWLAACQPAGGERPLEGEGVGEGRGEALDPEVLERLRALGYAD